MSGPDPRGPPGGGDPQQPPLAAGGSAVPAREAGLAPACPCRPFVVGILPKETASQDEDKESKKQDGILLTRPRRRLMCWVGLWQSLLFHLCVAPDLEGRISFFECCCSSSSTLTHRGSLASKQDSSPSREVSAISLDQEEPFENLCLHQLFTFEQHSLQFQIVLLPIHGHIHK